MITILIAKVSAPLAPSDLKHYYRQLPRYELDQILKFRHWKDSHLGLFGKLLLSNGLEALGYDANLIHNIERSQYNKPFITNGPFFNISHSGNYAVCALSNEGPLGIDIEYIDDIDIEELKNQLTEQEWNYVISSTAPQKQFYRLWSRKEAILKACGKGLTTHPGDVDTFKETVSLDRTWYLKQINIDENYVCSLASTEMQCQIRTKIINFYRHHS